MSNPGIVILGAGGHAETLITAIDYGKRYEIAGLLEEDTGRQGELVLDYPILGGLECLDLLLEQGVTRAIVAIGDNLAREKISREVMQAGFTLPPIIHELALVSPRADIGQGSFVHAFSHIGANCKVGEGAIISSHTTVGHGSQVGNWAHITPGVRLGGNTSIGNHAFLGMGCIILPGKTVKDHAFVGAGTLVNRDIPSHAMVAGRPGSIMRNNQGIAHDPLADQ